MSVTLRLLELLTRRGAVPRQLAIRLDAARGLGLRGAVRRLRAERRLAALGGDPWDAVYRGIWEEAAEAVGAEVVDLGDGFLELSRRSSRTRVWRQYTELDDWVTLRLALDRPIVFRLLLEAGVPVPEHVEYRSSELGAAARFLSAGGASCVLKPAAGTGVGAGITSGIRSYDQLLRATIRASQYGRLILEEQVPGSVYRMLFLNGELLDVVRKRPPSVVGDGDATIEKLVAAENERRIRAVGSAGFSLLKLDLDALFTLGAAGLDPSTVPAAGERVVVKTVTNQNRLEDNETVPITEIDRELVSVATRAAAAVGLRLAGVDLITPDLSSPLSVSGGRVIEVNGMPGLNHHYNVADPDRARRVAIPVLGAILERSERELTPGQGGHPEGASRSKGDDGS